MTPLLFSIFPTKLYFVYLFSAAGSKGSNSKQTCSLLVSGKKENTDRQKQKKQNNIYLNVKKVAHSLTILLTSSFALLLYYYLTSSFALLLFHSLTSSFALLLYHSLTSSFALLFYHSLTTSVSCSLTLSVSCYVVLLLSCCLLS